MVTYLVMKNNLKRTFATKFTYLVIVLIPVAISFISIISSSFSNSDIRVGVICNEKQFKEISDTFSEHPTIRYEMAESTSKHTDLITGKYQYLIDMTEKREDTTIKDTKQSLATIKAVANQNQESKVFLSQTDRTFALLLTAYMIIASIYATKMIKDKENKTRERFCFAGFSKGSYSFGYMASTALVTLLQLSLAVFLLTVFNRGFLVSFERALKMVVFIAAVASVFGVGIASFLKSELSANITASSIVVILSLLGGTFVSVEQMPRLLKYLSVISPIRWLQLLL